MPELFSDFAGDQAGFSGRSWFARAVRWTEEHWLALLIAGVVLQMGVLLAMIAFHAVPLVVGKRIMLHVRPVDPRDLFRGDYVVLTYDISNAPAGGIVGAQRPHYWRSDYGREDAWLEDQTVYVTLNPEPDGKHYRAGEVSVERPRNGIYIQGKYSPGDFRGGNLKFGIEAFYVQEGTGKVLEQMRNTNKLSAEIALAPWGRATLVALK